MVARCKFGDRLLKTQEQQQQHERKWRQVVVLGAGMDTRAWRFASPSCRFFEVDLPETQSYKRARVPAPQQQREVHFLPVDFESQRFEEELRAHPAFDPDEPTLFFWEGVSYYLRRDTSLGALRAIRSLCQAPGSAVYLDYLDAGDIEDPQEHHLGIKHMSALLRRLGEPLLCGFAPTKEGLQEELRDCGLRFRVSQHMGPRDIQREFLTDADSGRCSPCAHIFFALLEVD